MPYLIDRLEWVLHITVGFRKLRQNELVRSFLSYTSLLKLRIVALLLFVSLAAAFLAARGAWGEIPLALLLTVGIMAGGGAGALNHYIDRDLDALMERTKQRPLASGRIGKPLAALALGLSLIGISFIITLPLNAWQALFMLAGALIYVVIYTLWLKRRSPWSVIVGGAAGSCAVLSGWASVDSWLAPQPLLLSLLLFLWTPPHFWSLAILRVDDYRAAAVPMLPVVAGTVSAARWGLVNVLLVLATSLALVLVGDFGLLFIAVALIAGTSFVATAIWLALRANNVAARLHFRTSVLYLAAIFAGMILDVYFQGKAF